MALQVISVYQRFGKQEVLQDVSLTVEKGDCYGLLGHNGAGKTTLLRAALGLLKPASGSVAVDGFAIDRFPREARTRLGGLIEYPRFNETWTGLKNLSVLARLQGFDRRTSQTESQRVLAYVGLDTHSESTEHKKVRDFSQGMKQRLGIAQALLGNPSYVLLDEPLNGLDPQAIADMRLLIRRLTQEENRAVLISSHLLGEMSGLCNKIAILRQGVLLVEDGIDRLLETDKRLYRLSVAAEPGRTRALLTTLDLSPQDDRTASQNESTFLIDLSQMKPATLTRHLLDKEMDLLTLVRCDPSLEEVYLQLDSQAMEVVTSHRNTPPIPSRAHPEEYRAPERAFLRGIQYELTRLLSGLRIAAICMLPALCAFVSVSKMFQQAAADVEKVGDTLFSTTPMTAFDGVGQGLAVGLPILMVMITGLASQSLSGEQTKGTLRMLLLRPINRWQIALSKFCSLALVCLVSYALLVVVSLGVSSYWFDFSDLAEVLPNGRLFPLVKREEMFGYLWPALWAPIIPLVSYTAIGFALGSWIKNNVVALASTLGVILLIDLGRVFVTAEKHMGWLPSAHLPSPFGGHSFLRFYCNMVQGVSNASNPYAYLSLVAPLVWLVLMVVLATVALKRKAG
ncbi:MAG: ATP-binding cassette domain-containing protein [Planctomycetes bacterium]|nr:ATP-binding cassette domain-containing protein [Planctomycetota bacterium]